MASIASENETTFTLDNGTEIAKAGAPDLYQALKSGQGVGSSGAAIDQFALGGGGAPVSSPGAVGAPAAPKPLVGPSPLHIRTDAKQALAAAQAAEAPGAALTGGGGVGMLQSLENAPTDSELRVVPRDPRTPTGTNLGPVTLASSSTQRTSMDPKAQSQWEKSSNAVAEAVEAKANVEAETANAKLTEIQSITEQRKTYLEGAEHRRATQENYIRGKLKAVEAVDNQWMNAKVDGDRLFGDMSTGNRILAAISVALGGIGAAMTGKDNMALKIITDAIDRDIDVQKANIENMGKKAGHMRGALADYMKVTENEEAGHARTHANQLDYALAKIDEVIASNASKEVKASANVLKAQLTEQRDAKIADSTKIVQTNAYEQAQTKAGEIAPGDAWKEVQGLENQVNSLSELKELAEGTDFAGLGPIESRYEAAARQFGAGSPQAAQLKSEIGRFIQDRIKTLSGTGSSAAEMERIAATLMQSTDSEETFTTLLNRELDRSRTQAQIKRQSWETAGVRLPASIILPKYSGGGDSYGANKARK